MSLKIEVYGYTRNKAVYLYYYLLQFIYNATIPNGQTFVFALMMWNHKIKVRPISAFLKDIKA